MEQDSGDEAECFDIGRENIQDTCTEAESMDTTQHKVSETDLRLAQKELPSDAMQTKKGPAKSDHSQASVSQFERPGQKRKENSPAMTQTIKRFKPAVVSTDNNDKQSSSDPIMTCDDQQSSPNPLLAPSNQIRSASRQPWEDAQPSISDMSVVSPTTAFRRGHRILVDYLEPIPILEMFTTYDFISNRDVRDILEMKSTTEKNVKILEKVRSKGEEGYSLFKTYLLQTDQKLLLNYIEALELEEAIEPITEQLLIQQKEKLNNEMKRQSFTYDACGILHLLKDAFERGKEMTGHGQDITERICFRSFSSQLSLELDLRIYKIAEETLKTDSSESSVTIRTDRGQYTEENKSLISWMKHIFSFIKAIGVKVINLGRGSMILHMTCLTCKTLYNLIVALNSTAFNDLLLGLETCLERVTGQTIEIKASITQGNLRTVKQCLIDQGVIQNNNGDIMCDYHKEMVLQKYCFIHDVCCCTMCTEHSTCPGLIEATPDCTDVEKPERLELHNRRDYNVRIPEDTNTCCIGYSCSLENGMILLADKRNKRLKKLNSSYQVIDHVDIHDTPRHLCYIGDGKVAVTTRASTVRSFDRIHIVDTRKTLEVAMCVELPCPFARTAFYNGTLYLSTIEGIYAYNTDLQQRNLFRDSCDLFRSFDVPITVSNNGKNIYASDHHRIFLFDSEGDLLKTLTETYQYISDIFPFNDSGILLVDFFAKALIITGSSKEAEKVLIPNIESNIATVCYNKQASNIICGLTEGDSILIFDLPRSMQQV